jgi:hypothetical protein
MNGDDIHRLTFGISKSRYVAFLPEKAATYNPVNDETLPLARRINLGYRLPNTYRFSSSKLGFSLRGCTLAIHVPITLARSPFTPAQKLLSHLILTFASSYCCAD